MILPMPNDTDWEKRYQKEDTPWDKGDAAPGLVDWLKKYSLSKDSRILVPGCGRGHDAYACAQAGFETTGLDLSNQALAEARERYEEQSNLAFFPGDFLTEFPENPYDLVFEHTLYCAIDPERRDEYVDALGKWLKPGGYFLAIHFQFPLTSEGPPFGASREEIIDRFEPRFKLLEDWKPRKFEVRKEEERMFFWQLKSR